MSYFRAHSGSPPHSQAVPLESSSESVASVLRVSSRSSRPLTALRFYGKVLIENPANLGRHALAEGAIRATSCTRFRFTSNYPYIFAVQSGRKLNETMVLQVTDSGELILPAELV